MRLTLIDKIRLKLYFTLYSHKDITYTYNRKDESIIITMKIKGNEFNIKFYSPKNVFEMFKEIGIITNATGVTDPVILLSIYNIDDMMAIIKPDEEYTDGSIHMYRIGTVYKEYDGMSYVYYTDKGVYVNIDSYQKISTIVNNAIKITRSSGQRSVLRDSTLLSYEKYCRLLIHISEYLISRLPVTIQKDEIKTLLDEHFIEKKYDEIDE